MLVPDFTILFEDADCLVVAKPGGLLTQAPQGIDSLEFRIKRFLRQRDAIAGNVYLGVPHRIDRPVSGVLVFAKHVKAARKISQQFEGRMIAKTYWALVQGEVLPATGTWTDHLQKIDGEPRTVVVDSQHPEGRIAILHYRVLAHLPDKSLLEISLETGRTHQIRVQCASRGFPLIGDELYGSQLPFGPPSDDQRERLIALHARCLAFRHPTSKADLRFEAPLTQAWKEVGLPAEYLGPGWAGLI